MTLRLINAQWNSLTGGDAAETGSGPGSYDIRQSVWHVNVSATSPEMMAFEKSTSLTKESVLQCRGQWWRRMGDIQRAVRLGKVSLVNSLLNNKDVILTNL